jgi:putative sensory transduction regulator
LVTLLAAPLLVGPRVGAQQDGLKLDVVKGYLDKMGLQYVPHPKNADVVVVPSSENENAERVDMYVEVRSDRSLVLTAYPRLGGRYFNLSRALDREKLLLQLVEANHRSFATFFADPQGDIGMRFTFTTEDGVGFEAFRAAAKELLRIADQYTPRLEERMKKEAPAPKPGSKTGQ